MAEEPNYIILFCPYCGSPLEEGKEDPRCANCDNVINDGSKDFIVGRFTKSDAERLIALGVS